MYIYSHVDGRNFAHHLAWQAAAAALAGTRQCCRGGHEGARSGGDGAAEAAVSAGGVLGWSWGQ